MGVPSVALLEDTALGRDAAQGPGVSSWRQAQLLLDAVAWWHVQSFFHFISAGGSFDFHSRLPAPLEKVCSCFSLLSQTYLI